MSESAQLGSAASMSRLGIGGGTVGMLFVAILGANALTMAVLNFFELPGWTLSWIWLASAAAVGLLLRLGSVRLPRLGMRAHVLCWVAALVVGLPRLPYLIEPVLGYAVDAVAFDDNWHFQQLGPLVHSGSFPAVSSFDPALLLSFYYGPWLPGAVLWQVGGVLTFKQAFFIVHLLYTAAALYTAVYLGRLVFRTRLNRLVMFVVIALYGGFDAYAAPFARATTEWWAQDLGLLLQFSSTLTLMLWVPHHLAAAVAVAAFAHWVRSRRWTDRIVAGILLAAAVGASPFVCVGAVVLLGWWVWSRRLWISALVAAAIGLVLSLPTLWMYLIPRDRAFRPLMVIADGPLAERWPIGLAAYLLVVVLELGPLLLAAVLGRHRLSPVLTWLTCTYFLAPFLIGDTDYNNFGMRASIVPIFTLSVLATPVLADFVRSLRRRPAPGRIALSVLLVGYLSGGLLTWAEMMDQARHVSLSSDDKLHAAILHSNLQRGPADPAVVAAAAEQDYTWYLIEGSTRGLHHDLRPEDVELVSSDSPLRLTWRRLIG